LLRHAKYNLSLADARLSPDGKRIAFPVPVGLHKSRMAVARVTGKLIEEADWVWVTPEGENGYQPDWSPNGEWLYFLSDRTGHLTVQAVELGRELKPVGEQRMVFEFESGRLTMAEMRPRDIGLAVGKGKLALSAAEYKGGLWAVGK
jgi:tricorn protease-like protein